jgi:hypothetical protein
MPAKKDTSRKKSSVKRETQARDRSEDGLGW